MTRPLMIINNEVQSLNASGSPEKKKKKNAVKPRLKMSDIQPMYIIKKIRFYVEEKESEEKKLGIQGERKRKDKVNRMFPVFEPFVQ